MLKDWDGSMGLYARSIPWANRSGLKTASAGGVILAENCTSTAIGTWGVGVSVGVRLSESVGVKVGDKEGVGVSVIVGATVSVGGLVGVGETR